CGQGACGPHRVVHGASRGAERIESPGLYNRGHTPAGRGKAAAAPRDQAVAAAGRARGIREALRGGDGCLVILAGIRDPGSGIRDPGSDSDLNERPDSAPGSQAPDPDTSRLYCCGTALNDPNSPCVSSWIPAAKYNAFLSPPLPPLPNVIPHRPSMTIGFPFLPFSSPRYFPESGSNACNCPSPKF